MIRRISLVLLLVSLAGGCALFVPSYPYTNEYLPPQPVDGLESPVRLHHSLTVNFGPREISFRTVFEVNSEQSTFVLLTPMGSRALSVTQRGSDLSVRNLTDREFPVDPRRLYVDLQAMIWPELELKPPYSSRDEGRSTETTGTRIRRVLRNGQPFLNVRLPSSSTLGGVRELDHADGSYSLRLETELVEKNL